MRGVLLAKGSDFSIGRMPVGYCPGEVHMEEEGVQVKVQAEEEEIGETHGREQSEEKGENKQSLGRMTWMTMRMTKRAPCSVMCINECFRCVRKSDV